MFKTLRVLTLFSSHLTDNQKCPVLSFILIILSFMSCNSGNLYLSFPVSSNKLSELVSKNKMARSFIFVDIFYLINIILKYKTLSLLCLCVLTFPHGNAEPELFMRALR